MVDSRKLKLSDIATLIDMPLARLRTMRARNQTGMHDDGVAETLGEDAGRGWRNYSVADAVAISCVLELAERGLAIDVAASIVSGCRQFIHDADHPRTASRDDVFVGRIFYFVGEDHIGGPLRKLLPLIDKEVSEDIGAYQNGGGSTVIIINSSNHYRRIMEKLEC